VPPNTYETYKNIAPVIAKLKQKNWPEIAAEIVALEKLKPSWFKKPDMTAAAVPLDSLATKLSCHNPHRGYHTDRIARRCNSLLKLTYPYIESNPELMANLEDSYPANIAAVRKLKKTGWFSKKPSDAVLREPVEKLYKKMGCGWEGKAVGGPDLGGFKSSMANRLRNISAQATAVANNQRDAASLNLIARAYAARMNRSTPVKYVPRNDNSKQPPITQWVNSNFYEQNEGPPPSGTMAGGRWNSRRSRKSARSTTRRSQRRSHRRTKRSESNTRLNKRSHKRR
jgi:hypothetical protein